MRVSNFVRPESLFAVGGGVSDEQFENWLNEIFPRSRQSQATPVVKPAPTPSPTAQLTSAVASEFAKLGTRKKAESIADPHPPGVRKLAESIKLPGDRSAGFTQRTAEEPADGSEAQFESALPAGVAKFAASIKLPGGK